MVEWKDILGFENYYQISSEGEVKSLRSGRIMKPKYDKDGYKEYCLCVNDHRTYKRGHRLVAETFLSNPNNLPVVNHKDNNRTNNNVDNLEWCTVYENTIHGFSLRKGKTLSHLSKDELLDVIDKYNNGWTSQSIVDFYELTIRNIESIKSLADGKNHYYKTGIGLEVLDC